MLFFHYDKGDTSKAKIKLSVHGGVLKKAAEIDLQNRRNRKKTC